MSKLLSNKNTPILPLGLTPDSGGFEYVSYSALSQMLADNRLNLELSNEELHKTEAELVASRNKKDDYKRKISYITSAMEALMKKYKEFEKLLTTAKLELTEEEERLSSLNGKIHVGRDAVKKYSATALGLQMDIDSRIHAIKEEASVRYVQNCVEYLRTRRLAIPATSQQIVYTAHMNYNNELIRKAYPSIDPNKDWDLTGVNIILNFSLQAITPVGRVKNIRASLQ